MGGLQEEFDEGKKIIKDLILDQKTRSDIQEKEVHSKINEIT